MVSECKKCNLEKEEAKISSKWIKCKNKNIKKLKKMWVNIYLKVSDDFLNMKESTVWVK